MIKSIVRAMGDYAPVEITMPDSAFVCPSTLLTRRVPLVLEGDRGILFGAQVVRAMRELSKDENLRRSSLVRPSALIRRR